MTKLFLPATLAVVASLVGSLSAQGGGKLSPPGPPEPTMRTLQEIEPRVPPIADADTTNAVKTNGPDYHFIFTAPGSFYLTENLTVTKAGGVASNLTSTNPKANFSN